MVSTLPEIYSFIKKFMINNYNRRYKKDRIDDLI